MNELKNARYAIPVVLFAGILWSFGPYVVRNIDQPETVPWQYLFTRGFVIFTLLNVYLYQFWDYCLMSFIQFLKLIFMILT